MNETDFTALCARINAALDVQDVINVLEYESDKAVKAMGLWRLFCPVHGERLFRTLLINPRRNTYHCEYSGCPAHRPGDLIDLIGRRWEFSRPRAVVHLVDILGPDKLRLTSAQVTALRNYADGAGAG